MQSPKCAAAGFGVRWIAYLIDCLIVGLATAVLTLPITIVRLMNWNSFWNRQVLFQFTAYAILTYCIRAVYFVICTYAFQCTLGKRLLRIHVETKDGEKLTFVNALFRETVGRFLSGILYIGYLIALAGRDHLALHDMICDTRVRYTGLTELIPAPDVTDAQTAFQTPFPGAETPSSDVTDAQTVFQTPFPGAETPSSDVTDAQTVSKTSSPETGIYGVDADGADRAEKPDLQEKPPFPENEEET